MNGIKKVSAARARQGGVSIVEALVALLVLSVGMLGIAGMYLQSVQSSRTAVVRTTAVQLVNDMADRIRANRTAQTSYAVKRGDEPGAAGKDCAKNDCTPTELAAYDLDQWFTAVKAGLPKTLNGKNPEIEIAYTPGASSLEPARYVVLAAWQEPGDTTFLTAQVEVVQLGGPST